MKRIIRIISLLLCLITSFTFFTACGDKEYTKQGKTIYFGSYPQVEVSDDSLKEALLTLSGNPKSDIDGWKSYKYYVDSDKSDCVYYKDVEYENEKYRGVYIKEYRPFWKDTVSNANNTYQDENGYESANVYWFKYQPIAWEMVDKEDGVATLVSKVAIDGQAYHNSYALFSDGYHCIFDNYIKGFSIEPDDEDTIFANDYGHSDIRIFLNRTFYETAFNSEQKNIIQTVTIDNSEESTGFANSFVGEDTNDKVYLLSYVEATSYYKKDSQRIKQATDYAKSQGAQISDKEEELGNCNWWLRSPHYNYSNCAWNVSFDGGVKYTELDHVFIGVVPVIQIKL